MNEEMTSEYNLDVCILSARRRPRRNSETEGTTRVQLACLYCRSKRIRCSGTRPICEVGFRINND